MRIKSEYAKERISNVVTYKPKYFIISEGSKTEPRYFEGLNSSVITENINIINILRDYIDNGKSHPTHLIHLLASFLENAEERVITVEELRNRILNWHHENQEKVDIESIMIVFDKIFERKNHKVKYEELEEIIVKLFKSEFYKDLALNFQEYVLLQDTTYSESVDTLNLVIDRDKYNFLENQYEVVKDYCKENNINMYVSNPNFEFWLLLHFSEVEKEDRLKLLLNKKVSKSKRYIDKRLSEICNYNKNKLNFKIFEPLIEDAIKREKNYAEDVELLKDELGSNVGLLVDKMINHK